jgi:PIN domain nuclease of toxin-antitoxin system
VSGYLLDACALIALLNDEDGAEHVEALLDRGGVEMAAINLLEVAYDAVRRTKRPEAAVLPLRHAEQEGVRILWELSEAELLAAARWKARGRLSLADAVALGIAETKGLSLVTSDHHEFDVLEPLGLVKFEWIR